ncbi:uncharacterized protein [Diadema setosum]|uniref:uncharacterized protein n=1 Tax=Diadema setosum TaxID=31175 RepID=UPI003B3A5566
MTTSRQNKQDDEAREIFVDGHALEEVHQCKYLGAMMNEEATSTTEMKTRMAMATALLAKMNHVWRSREVREKTKIELMKALSTSIALCGCESWTLSKNLEKKIAAFEIHCRCFRRLLGIHWHDCRTNASVLEEIRRKVRDYEPLLDVMKRRKMQRFGHVTRRPGTLAHTIMHGRVDGRRAQGRPRRNWVDDVRRWAEKPVEICMRMAQDKETWRTTFQCPNGRNATGVT